MRGVGRKGRMYSRSCLLGVRSRDFDGFGRWGMEMHTHPLSSSIRLSLTT